NGVDLRRFPYPPPPRSTEHSGPRVGIVANLRPVKGLEDFVQAAATVSRRHPETSFEVAGEGELRPQLERQAAELGLGARFRLLGPVADIPNFLAQIDVAVLSSHSEGMSNALLEYMAAGKAIVATRVGGNRCLIKHDV